MRFDIGGRDPARARDEHPQGRVGRGAERRLRVRAPAGAGRRAHAAHLRRVPRRWRQTPDARGAAAARPGRRRSRTSRRSTCATSSRRSRRSSTTSRSASRSSARVTLVGGVLILVGAVAMTKFQRLYEAAIYRTLGASTRLLASMVAIEYGLLGLLAGAAGGGRRARPCPGRWPASCSTSTGVRRPGSSPPASSSRPLRSALVGLAASADVLVRKPLATLRSE